MKILSELRYDGYDLGLWITTEWFLFEWQGVLYKIPPGFVLDFYSIPRFLRWWRAPNRGRGNKPALIHDFLSRFFALLNLSVRDTDVAFWDAMILLRFPAYSTRVKYLGVRIGEWLFLRGRGWGDPGRKVRRAMERHGDSWTAYTVAVRQANRERFNRTGT